jgi:hypothetical protein
MENAIIVGNNQPGVDTAIVLPEIKQIQPEYEFSDLIWRLPMRFGSNPKDWTLVHVTLYEKTYYC